MRAPCFAFFLTLCLAFLATAAHAAGVAVIYNAGADANDKAFIAAALQGAARAKEARGIEYREYNITEEKQTEGAWRRALEESGARAVVAIGFQNTGSVMKFAPDYPHMRFVVIDGMVPPLYPNIQSVLFKDQEGAFLAGAAAALTSKSGVIGFVGGMDVPLMRNFAYGYLQGAKHVRPGIRVLQTMLGATEEAWRNPAKAETVAHRQFADGADVIFAAAGASGLGVLKAAKAESRLAIGVDTNQNGLYPGSVLTSMIKRVDQAVYDAMVSAQSAAWEPGIKYLGLEDQALGLAQDENNRNLLSAETLEALEALRQRILRGELEVDTYAPR